MDISAPETTVKMEVERIIGRFLTPDSEGDTLEIDWK